MQVNVEKAVVGYGQRMIWLYVIVVTVSQLTLHGTTASILLFGASSANLRYHITNCRPPRAVVAYARRRP